MKIVKISEKCLYTNYLFVCFAVYKTFSTVPRFCFFFIFCQIFQIKDCRVLIVLGSGCFGYFYNLSRIFQFPLKNMKKCTIPGIKAAEKNGHIVALTSEAD